MTQLGFNGCFFKHICRFFDARTFLRSIKARSFVIIIVKAWSNNRMRWHHSSESYVVALHKEKKQLQEQVLSKCFRLNSLVTLCILVHVLKVIKTTIKPYHSGFGSVLFYGKLLWLLPLCSYSHTTWPFTPNLCKITCLSACFCLWFFVAWSPIPPGSNRITEAILLKRIISNS